MNTDFEKPHKKKRNVFLSKKNCEQVGRNFGKVFSTCEKRRKPCVTLKLNTTLTLDIMFIVTYIFFLYDILYLKKKKLHGTKQYNESAAVLFITR